MSKSIQFNYFYGKEADSFTFYKIPKLLITDTYFSEISNDAKILYGLMLDRMSLSMKNGWIDSENRVYINYSIEDICKHLNVGKNTAVKALAELDTEKGIGLIEKNKRGQGKATIIYVKNFMIDAEKTEQVQKQADSQEFENQTPEANDTDSKVYKLNFKNPKIQTSRSLENKPLEVYISNPNYNNIYNKNNISENKSNLIISGDEVGSDIAYYTNLVKSNLEIDLLKTRNPLDTKLYDEIYNLVLDTVINQAPYIVIAKSKYPTDIVRERFLKLDSGHVEYVITCLKDTKTRIANIKKYMLTALFNAPVTINSYYMAEVSYDMN